ncbi:MAG: T9SS type A sorting domain-containing protein [Flavobacteriales bacterium]
MQHPFSLLFCALLSMASHAVSGQFAAEPLFIANGGQLLNQHGEVNETVHYQLALPNCNVLLREEGFSYDTWQRDAEGDLHFHRIDVDFAHADRLRLEPVGGEAVNFAYTDGRCIQTTGYSAVVYRDLYPHIDVVFRLNSDGRNGHRFEYDVLVGEGARIDDVVLTYSGMEAPEVHDQRIDLETRFGSLHEAMPLAYLSDTGEAIDVRYRQINAHQVGFADPSGQLGLCAAVIDPVTAVEWSTYYATTDYTSIRLLETLPGGDFIAGSSTEATTGIATEGAHQVNLTGPFLPPFGDFTRSCFLVRFNSAGQRIWGTYFGGERSDSERGLHIFQDKILLVGGASSTTAIATENAWLSESQGVGQNFVACFNHDGTLSWSTYIYGAPNKDPAVNNINITDVCADASGVTIGGASQQLLPVTSGFDIVPHEDNDYNGFVLRLSWQGDLIWCRYMHQGGGSVRLLAEEGNVIVVGSTSDGSLATPDAPVGSISGGLGHYLARLDDQGQIEFLTYLPTTSEDTWFEYLRTLVKMGDAYYYCGVTIRSGMAVGDVHQTEFQGGPNDPMMILTKVDATTHEVVWRTYYGGEGEDLCEDLAPMPDGSLCLVGFTRGSEGMATTGALEESTMGSYNSGVIARFSTEGELIAATYLGGDESTIIESVAVIENDLLVGGMTANQNFGTVGAHEPFFGTNTNLNAFITRFSTETGVVEQVRRAVQCYPNPAVQRLNLSVGDAQCTHIRVFDAQGSQVIDQACSAVSGTVVIDVSQLATGRYSVVVETHDGGQAYGSFLRIAQ